jgi:hypothetical protein
MVVFSAIYPVLKGVRINQTRRAANHDGTP